METPLWVSINYKIVSKQRILDALYDSFLFIVAIVLLTYCIFFNQFSFNYETAEKKHYLLASIISVFPLSCLYFFLRPRQNGRLMMLVYTGVICCISLVLTFSDFYSFSNEHFFLVVLFFAFHFTVFLSWRRKIHLMQCLILFFLAIFVYQLVVGVYQYIEELEKSFLTVRGTLKNSGIYACYLVAHLPFTYYACFQFNWNHIGSNSANSLDNEVVSAPVKHSYKTLVGFVKLFFMTIIFLAACFSLYQTQSRTAVIGLGATIIFLFGLKRKIVFGQSLMPQKRLWKVFLAIVALLLGVWIWYLTTQKQLSSSGRFLKLEIAGDHLLDQFWFGTGLGRFTWYYPQWQASYFENNVHSPHQYFLSASESYLLFNEYVQLFKETGLVGCTLLLAGLVNFFKSKSRGNKNLLNATKATVISILACGFTSYPFHVNVFVFLLLFCFTLAFFLDETRVIYNSGARASLFLPKCFIALTFIISLGPLYLGIRHLEAVSKWQQIRENEISFTDDTKYIYALLKKDGKFLTEFGQYLLERGIDNRTAIQALVDAKKFFLSKSSLQTTAYAFQQIGDYQKAIEYFTLLNNFIPSHFSTKLQLLRLYTKMGDYTKANDLANLILKMPVKIPSSEVNRIKSETTRILKQIRQAQFGHRVVYPLGN